MDLNHVIYKITIFIANLNFIKCTLILRLFCVNLIQTYDNTFSS